jgi:hypothetical protein
MMSLLLRQPTRGVDVPEVESPPDEKIDGPRIRCPRCGWEPSRDHKWQCSCGHVWNTFQTGGICPACDRVWTATQCVRCGEWSPHAEWYAFDST